METTTILEPVAEVRRASADVIPLSFLEQMKGKRLAFVSNEWRCLSVIWERLGELFRQSGVVESFTTIIPTGYAAPEETLRGIRERSDAAVVGLAG